jgi:hypothetical protein
MTEQSARQVANALMGAAAIGVAVTILRKPALRRMATGLIVAAVTSGIPTWLGREVRHAWYATGDHPGTRGGL